MHSSTARTLLENSVIGFRISTRFQAHSFQTDFIFEIISSSLSKGVFSLPSYTFVLTRRNNPKECCLVILEATDLFDLNVAIWFLSENLERDYWYGSLHHLEWKSRTAKTFLSFHRTKCFKSLYFQEIKINCTKIVPKTIKISLFLFYCVNCEASSHDFLKLF